MIYFFALAFSRTEKGEARAEAAIRALNEEHAISLASHFEGDGQGAVALAKSGEPPVPMGEGVEILARFGEVPDDNVLIPERARLPWPRPPRPFRNRWLDRVRNRELHATRGFADGWAACASRNRARRLVARAHRRSLAMTSLVAVALSLSGGAMLIITAKAGQRESRLMEMARPACTHTAITNEELRRLVRNEYYTGTDKQNTLRSVVALCQANPRML